MALFDSYIQEKIERSTLYNCIHDLSMSFFCKNLEKDIDQSINEYCLTIPK